MSVCVLAWSVSPPTAQLIFSTRRAEELQAEFTGPQLSDIIVALGKLGYRPPAHVLDAFVHHISNRVHELPLGGTDELAEVGEGRCSTQQHPTFASWLDLACACLACTCGIGGPGLPLKKTGGQSKCRRWLITGFICLMRVADLGFSSHGSLMLMVPVRTCTHALMLNHTPTIQRKHGAHARRRCC